MTVTAVVFDWGGTLAEFVSAELVDAWRLAARHLAPDREDELTDRMVAVEAAFWATTASHQRSATLADLLAAAAAELHLDVAEALLEEAAVRHLDSWTPHIRHDPDAAPTLRRAAGPGAAHRAAVEHPLAPGLPRALPRAGRAGRADRRPPVHQRDAVPEAASRPPSGPPSTPSGSTTRPPPCSWATVRGTTSRAPPASGCVPSSAPTRWSTRTVPRPTPASPPCPSCSGWSTRRDGGRRSGDGGHAPHAVVPVPGQVAPELDALAGRGGRGTCRSWPGSRPRAPTPRPDGRRGRARCPSRGARGRRRRR